MRCPCRGPARGFGPRFAGASGVYLGNPHPLPTGAARPTATGPADFLSVARRSPDCRATAGAPHAGPAAAACGGASLRTRRGHALGKRPARGWRFRCVVERCGSRCTDDARPRAPANATTVREAPDAQPGPRSGNQASGGLPKAKWRDPSPSGAQRPSAAGAILRGRRRKPREAGPKPLAGPRARLRVRRRRVAEGGWRRRAY